MAFSAALRREVAPFAARAIGGGAAHRCTFFRPLLTWSSSAQETRRAIRGASSSRPFSSEAFDASLVQVIDSEIMFAKESDDQYRMGEVPDQFPFDLRDEPGTATVILTRNYAGEKIEIAASMSNLVTGEDGNYDDDDNNDAQSPAQSCIPLIVKLSKRKGPRLEFHCTAFPDEISIDSMTVKESGHSDHLIAFEGPDFLELDEDLQKCFYRYMEIRGITPANMNFLHEYMINKDSREYLLWLKNLKSFIKM